MALVFLREQQLLLFFQDATHLATKWRNRLLSSTAELRLGDQSISISHLYSIIDNGKFTKIDHGLTKSDINPKDRQNFSSCVKLTSDDLFKILKDNVDTQGTLIYLQMLKMIIMVYIDKKTTIAAREYAFFSCCLGQSVKLFTSDVSHLIKLYFRSSICLVRCIFLSNMVNMDQIENIQYNTILRKNQKQIFYY